MLPVIFQEIKIVIHGVSCQYLTLFSIQCHARSNKLKDFLIFFRKLRSLVIANLATLTVVTQWRYPDTKILRPQQDYQGVWLRHYVPVERRAANQQQLFGPIPLTNEEKRQQRGSFAG